MLFYNEKIQQDIFRQIVMAPKNNRSWLFDRYIREYNKDPELVNSLQNIKKWVLLALDVKVKTYFEIDIAGYFGRFYYDFFDCLQSSNPSRCMENAFSGILKDRDYSENLIKLRGGELMENELEDEIARLVETNRYLVYLTAVKNAFDQNLDYQDIIKAKLSEVNKMKHSGKWAALFCKYLDRFNLRERGSLSQDQFCKSVLDEFGIGILYRARTRKDFGDPTIDNPEYIHGMVRELFPLISDRAIAMQLEQYLKEKKIYKPI